MNENFFTRHYHYAVIRRHSELKASGANPDLNAVRHEILRLDGIHLSEGDVARYLLMPLESGRRGQSATSAKADSASRRASRASAQAGNSSEHADACLAHQEAARAHRAAASYHDDQADFHSDKSKPKTDAAETQPAELDCARAARSLLRDGELPDEIMFMPAGVHTICPSCGGKPVVVTVEVNETTAERIERQREILASGVNMPYFSIDHGTQIAAFWPRKFVFDTRLDATGLMATGVWAEGDWSDAGREAVAGKTVRSFSPTFFTNTLRSSPDKPAQVICNASAKLNMGAVLCDPAFTTISPLWSTARVAA